MEVQYNGIVGRYAISNKDFRPGEEIFSEIPFTYGPKADSPVVCLGCHTPLKIIRLCSSCGWPVCKQQCESMPIHKDLECRIFSKSSVPFQKVNNLFDSCLQYECITPLRVLLTKQINPNRWETEVKDMEAHNGERKNKPIWKFNEVNIVNYIRGPCKLGDVFDQELIHTVCGILESNAFEARSISGYPIRCLYPKLAILSHNCVSNINHSICCTGLGDCKDFRVSVRASINIKIGEELFSSYTYSLWPTLMRREHLQESKYFDCCCARCSDPIELGTHLSSVKCTDCDNGLIMSINPLDSYEKWKCKNCGNIKTANYIKSTFMNAQMEIDSAECYKGNEQDRIKLLEKLLEKYTGILHLQNSYCCIIRLSLIKMYGRIANCASKNQLNKMLSYCTEVLEILDVIEPGYSRIRGMTLYELYKAMILMVRLHQTDQNYLKDNLLKIMEVLKESRDILESEDSSSIEGKTGQVANNDLFQLEEYFVQLRENKVSIADLLHTLHIKL